MPPLTGLKHQVVKVNDLHCPATRTLTKQTQQAERIIMRRLIDRLIDRRQRADAFWWQCIAFLKYISVHAIQFKPRRQTVLCGGVKRFFADKARILPPAAIYPTASQQHDRYIIASRIKTAAKKPPAANRDDVYVFAAECADRPPRSLLHLALFAQI